MTNYSRGMIKQIEEQTEENERLKSENSALRRENRDLRVRMENLESRIETIVAKAVAQATVPLYERIAFLEADVARKDKEILRLKAQFNKDSSNSSKPPGTDGLKKVPNSREASGKKPGGQPGHKGRTLKVPENLDELVKEGKAKKRIVDLSEGATNYISVWEIDLEINTVYTEYRYPVGAMPGVHYGSNLKTLSVLLSNEGLVAEGRLSDFFRGVSHGLITVTEGTIEGFNREAAQKVDIEEIKQEVLNGAVLHIDETPVRCAQKLEYGKDVPETAKNTSFDATVRTHSTEKATLYTVNPHKDDEGVKHDGILSEYCGILSHDHDKKYYKYGENHATCGAHLSRELKGLFELYNIAWANEFRRFYTGMNDFKNTTAECPIEQLGEFERTYDKLLDEGDAVLLGMEPKSFGFAELRPILKRLRDYKDAYMLFIRDYAAPFTNNQAERDLRLCKTKQKVSGCFRTWDGLLCYAKIRSFISTAKKQAKDLFDSVSSLFAPAPSPAE